MKSLQQPPPTTRKETREQRGLELYRGAGIIHEGHGRYRVPGCSAGSYEVDLKVFTDEPETCSCPDRAPVCKHIFAATIHRAKSRVAARRAQTARTKARASRASLAGLAASL
jgi:hypothetical protein